MNPIEIRRIREREELARWLARYDRDPPEVIDRRRRLLRGEK